MLNDTVNLNLPLESFLRVLWTRNEVSELERSHLLFELLKILLELDCDFFQLLSIYSEHTLTFPQQNALLLLSPSPKQILSITRNHVRESIPHWTGSKFHTGPIEEVVESIYNHLLRGESGMCVYDSNLNPRNPKAVNDRYVLIIQDGVKAFFDINRRSKVLFDQ